MLEKAEPIPSATKKTAAPGTAQKRIELPPDGMRTALGSTSEAFQVTTLGQALEALWRPGWKSDESKDREIKAAYDALCSISPRSELEGMLAVQMIAVHNAAMECMRRAMKEEQTFEGRDTNLKHAAKLMSLYERQLAALDKRRGKGQQKITVEDVTVEAGGQAIVGDVSVSGERGHRADGGGQLSSQATDVLPTARRTKARVPCRGQPDR